MTAYVNGENMAAINRTVEELKKDREFDKFCERADNQMLYGQDTVPVAEGLVDELQRVGYKSIIESSEKTKALAEMAKDIEEHPMKVIELKKNRRQKRAEAFAMKRAFKKEYKKMLSKFNNASKLEHKLEGDEIKEQQESIS